jgi:hypothetical protein
MEKNFTPATSNRFYKKIYFILMIILLSISGYSQNVSINTTGAQPNPAAGLDVDFANMGLLIPRVELTGTASFLPLSAHVAGMIVYNTATTGDVTPGFYYNKGDGWVAGFPKGNSVGNMLYWNGTAWVLIPAGTPGQYLQMSFSNTPSWIGSAFATLSTNVVSSINAATAVSGGNITTDGGSPILKRGICWKTSPNPSIGDSVILTGSGVGTFTGTLTSLLPGTKYYVKAFAFNSTIINYGNEVSFTTNATIPTIASTSSISSKTATTAISGGDIGSDGGSAILAKGVCWGTSSNPTLGVNNFTTNGTGSGSFASNITGLNGNTTYYVRAYATNSVGTSYGSVDVSFTTLPLTYTVGQNLDYGYVAYVDGSGNGFIVSNDIPFNGEFGCSGTILGTAGSNAIGTGLANTKTILAACATRPIAASVAKAHNGGGFSDWYLPSWNEWDQINSVVNLVGFNPIPVNNYFTSSETPWTNETTVVAFTFNGATGYANTVPKTGNAGGFVVNSLRAIRTFSQNGYAIINSTTATNITSSSATLGGEVTSEGGAPVTVRGVCWSTSQNPVVTNSHTSDGSGGGLFTSSLTGLSTGTTYYARAYSSNAYGTTYGTQVSFTTVGQVLAIGVSYQGGKIAYILQPTDPGYVAGETHGLIAATADLPGTWTWGCQGVSLNGCQGAAIGSGKQNTIDIMAGCAEADIAARKASSYTSGGYSDWYLPNLTELLQLFTNRVAIGGFTTQSYWSSEQNLANSANFMNFSWGIGQANVKSATQLIRPVRSF